MVLNNLTRSLAVNAYRFLHGAGEAEMAAWLDERQSELSDERLAEMLTRCNTRLGTEIISLSQTGYESHGASATLLIGQASLAHLDASHVSVHSYFDRAPGLGQVRLELEVSTCGDEHPAGVIELLTDFFSPDYLQLDYRVRGLDVLSDGGVRHADSSLDACFLALPGFEVGERNSSDRASWAELWRCGFDRGLIPGLEQVQIQ